MSFQNALCARVVKTGDMTSVLNFGLTSADFTSPADRALWELLHAYYHTPRFLGSIIPAAALREMFPTLLLVDDYPTMTIAGLCAEVRRERVVAESREHCVEFSNGISPIADPGPLLARLHSQITSLISLSTAGETDIPFDKGVTNVMARLRMMKDGVDLSIMKWPWEVLQQATQGVQPSDYVIFYGRPKSMKTWVLAYLIGWSWGQDKRVLVYTKEMTPDNIYARTMACIARVTYDAVRAGTATPEELERLVGVERDVLSDVYNSSRLVVLSGRDVPDGGDTVAWLGSKVERYKPDILFVDGMYLLSDQRKHSSDHQRVMNISRDLRALTLATKVPLIATMQANRKAAGHADANLDEIAYSDAISQDCTIAARTIASKTSPLISIVIGGSREFKLHGFRINAVPANNFLWHSNMTEADVEKEREQDAADTEEKKKKGKRNPKTSEEVRKPELPVQQIVDARMSMNGA